MIQRSGILCVVSGPAGSGKTTLCQAARDLEGCYYTVSCTTRSPRAGEVDGRDYFFLSEEEFENRISRSEFLEHAVVHGKRYGTLRSEVVCHLERGKDVVIDLDVQGAAQIRSDADPLIGASRVDVFIVVPAKELHARLAARGTESEGQIDLRMRNAEEEMREWDKYAYTIVSGTKEADLARMRAILGAERCRSSRLPLSPF